MGSRCELQGAGSFAAATNTDAHPSTEILSKSTKKFYDPQSTVFLPQVGNRFHLRMATPVKAQGGGISPQSHSISVGMQTAFPNNFTADRHDGVNNHSGTQAVKDASVSTLDTISTSPPNEAGNNAVLHDYSPPVGEPGLLRLRSPSRECLFKRRCPQMRPRQGDGATVRGLWTLVQCRLHIGFLELLTTFLALTFFVVFCLLGLIE